VDGHVARETARAASVPEPIVLDGPWRFETDSLNALVLDRWEASPERENGLTETPADADPDGWIELGPGAWSYQLPAEPVRDYPIGVWYRVPFGVDAVPSRLELVIDGFDGTGVAIWLNGEQITGPPVRSSFDAQMRSLDLTPKVRAGGNELAIRLSASEPTGGIVDRIKLMGVFSLIGDAEGTYRIAAAIAEMPSEPWTEHGYPYLSGTATYRRTFDLPEGFAGHRAFLHVPMRDDVLQVTVNGRPAGVRLWDPYEVEVTELLIPGANGVSLSVTNTLANLLNGVDRPSGLAGPPTLVARASFEFDLAKAETAQTET